ncbi:MAG: sugar ABC transporter permease [Thermotogae bacterium]|nr:sugar ABC transporter permease [Thermotogota bacterium]
MKQHVPRFVLCILIPTFVWFAIFRFGPLLYALFLSLHKWSYWDNVHPFVGFRNYISILHDNLFLHSLLNTFYFAFAVTPLQICIGLLSALLLDELIGKIRKGFFRSVFFLPVVVSGVGVSLIWRWLYDPTFGYLNEILSFFGLPPQGWLRSYSQAMPSIIIMSAWKNFGFYMVIFLTALQGIPESLYGAAKIDGANRIQLIKYIKLPLLIPAFTVSVVISLIGALQVFAEPYLMTNGGPGYATTVTVLLIQNTAFTEGNMGRASAMSFVLFLIIFIITLIEIKLFRKREVSY